MEGRLFMAERCQVRVKRRLRKLPLIIKVAFLLAVSFVFFILFSFVTDERLITFLSVDAVALALLMGLSYYLLGHRVFALTLKTWALGWTLYVPVAVAVLLSGLTVSLFVSFESPLHRWLYAFSYLLRALGVILGGLVFVEILQPSQFLRFGVVGLGLAFLARIIEVAIEEIFQIVDVLKMQGDWPEAPGRYRGKLRTLWFTIRSSPMLISIVFRNMIWWFLPWGLISLKRISKDLKETKNEPED
jgi:hypothetical protein